MSVFELSMEEIAAIKASTESDRVLARRYGVTVEVISFIGSLGPQGLYPGKIVQVPSIGRQLHNHSGLVDRRKKRPKAPPVTALVGPTIAGSMEDFVPPEARSGRPMVTR